MSEQRPANEQELVEYVRAIDVQAPPALHQHVNRLVRDSERSRSAASWLPRLPLRSPRIAGATVAGLAVAAVLAILLSTSGSTGSKSTLRAASALALEPATRSAPSEDRAQPGTLRAHEEDVSFPYWEDALGYRAAGMRRDSVAGRTATTVFYVDSRGARVGYTIVGGHAPSIGGSVRVLHSVPFHELTIDGHPEVAWLRDGRLCILASRNTSQAALLKLASADLRPQAS